MVSFGAQSDAAKNTWALSATATEGVTPLPFPIFAGGSRSTCTTNRNLAVNLKGGAQLSGKDASFRIIPQNASADCNTVYLQIVGGTKNGQYLSYGDCTSTNGFTVSKTKTSATLWKLAPSGQPDFPLTENHTHDNEVTKSYMANGVEFYMVPQNTSLEPSVLTFDKGVVYVGTNDANTVISFICPQLSFDMTEISTKVTIEVNIKQGGGQLNQQSGAGAVHLGGMSWEIWGQFNLPGVPSFNLTKDEAAQVAIVDDQGNSDLYFTNIAKNSTDDAVAIGVWGVVGKTYPNQTPQQLAVLEFAKMYFIPGLLIEGTTLQWNIYLQRFTVPKGSEYADIAHKHEMFDPSPTAVAASVGYYTPDASSAPAAPAPGSGGGYQKMSTAMFCLVSFISALLF